MDRREVALGLTRIAVENVFVLHGEEPEIKTVFAAYRQAFEGVCLASTILESGKANEQEG